ncbi:L-arabinitol 4-dehydrogenase [Armillaria novae-zelandiae]|uniref:L-arabinitol 4-dehydrogenase n=1 Tax=Armillaria novae-zelandiae TaxID=153914 RepID=A0AA39PVN7_9AGAR|nr:L-arabinitol 4-dehydrogenase [Armillaria novae-zelandiae]
MATANAKLYDPRQVLDHPEFKILGPNDKPTKGANIAVFYNHHHELHMVEKPRPKPGPGQVLLHVRASGICGSDIHYWRHGRIGNMVLHDECGSGHESAGEVIELGEGVTELKVGDRVTIEAEIPCFQPSCEPCRTGKYNGCPNVVFLSAPPYHGTLTKWHVHPAAWLHRIPDNMTFEEGALCEPLTVALAGVEGSGLRLGDPTLICGAGPIGLATLLSARAAGAEPIVITDLFQNRLDFAKKLVPTVRTVLIERDLSLEDQAAKIKAAAGMAFRVGLECTGVESSIATAAYTIKFGGTLMVIGVGKSPQTYPFMQLSLNEINLKFINRYVDQYPKAIRLISGGLIDMKPLVTHRFALEDAMDAFNVAADLTQGAIKVQIQDTED